MSQRQFFLLAVALCLLAASTLASALGGKPLVTPITKDGSTSLYTSPLKDGRPLVLDLSGPLIWSTCDDASHPTLELYERECTEAIRYTRPECWAYAGGSDGGGYGRGKCVAHPYNPVAGRCASGDMTRTTLSASATDGKNPLYPVSFPAVASCAPPSLLDKLPAGAAGVAGLARSDLSLPAQVVATQGVARKFALCLPGVAIFGGGPFFLLPPWLLEITSAMGSTPLHRFQEQPGYYIWINGINVNQNPVPLGYYNSGTGAAAGQLVVGFSTTIPYTALRPDVYRPFVEAFDNASTSGFGMQRVAAAAPFELCYNQSKLWSTRIGYAVPQIDLILEDSTRYGVFGANSLVQVDDATVCLAFVEMKPEELGYGNGQAPAVVIGGFQMENNLLVFDEEKQVLGYSTLLLFRQTTCSNFNFTMAA
ncbi:unnamed protein product [Urochloa decumbens]|uniref:Peptidase A1 domain-containing protein n=1 Tax=Urochloa decumbens TaxID=240449 RepID=A0ABC8YM23_9POAL